MPEYSLVIVDASRIQDYIFNSNVLKQNAGASYLVNCATDQWVCELIPQSNNLKQSGPKIQFTNEHILKDKLDCELVYIGGGNAVLIFIKTDEKDYAGEFIKALSKKILLEAPGLRVVIARQQFAPNELLGGKEGVLQKTFNEVARLKAQNQYFTGELCLPVIVPCTYTGQPAISTDQKNRPISAEVKAKLDLASVAHDRLIDYINLPDDYGQAPKEFDDLGISKGESSYIAVCYTDGNKMKDRFLTLRDEFCSVTDTGKICDINIHYIEALRKLSESIKEAQMKALRSTVMYLAQSKTKDKDTGKEFIADQIQIKNGLLPFRPIVFGGDDLTFVCNGQLGLTLTAYYLQKLSQQELSDHTRLEARGGVAIVKSHYPFSRAFNLATELANSAKKYIRSRGVPCTALDWHIEKGSGITDLDKTRQRSYRTKEGSLLMRPVCLSHQESDWRSWDNFMKIVTEFSSNHIWVGHNSKIHRLEELFLDGSKAVNAYLKIQPGSPWKLPEPEMPPNQIYSTDEARCFYFDALEALDFIVLMKG